MRKNTVPSFVTWQVLGERNQPVLSAPISFWLAASKQYRVTGTCYTSADKRHSWEMSIRHARGCDVTTQSYWTWNQVMLHTHSLKHRCTQNTPLQQQTNITCNVNQILTVIIPLENTHTCKKKFFNSQGPIKSPTVTSNTKSHQRLVFYWSFLLCFSPSTKKY